MVYFTAQLSVEGHSTHSLLGRILSPKFNTAAHQRGISEGAPW